MRDQYPAVDVRDDLRVIDAGHVVTSAGVSAGIDMALHVVARLHDDETANWTARRMEYKQDMSRRVTNPPNPGDGSD